MSKGLPTDVKKCWPCFNANLLCLLCVSISMNNMICVRKQEELFENKDNSSLVSSYNYKMVYSHTVRANGVVVLKHVNSCYSSRVPWIHLTLRILGNSPGTWRNRRDVAHGHRPSDLVPPWLLQSSDASCGLCWPEIQAQTSDRFCTTLRSVNKYSDSSGSGLVGARTGTHWGGSKYSGWGLRFSAPNPLG